jgi:hypothetical protein
MKIRYKAWNEKEGVMIDLKEITPPLLSVEGVDGIFIPFIEHIVILQYIGLRDRGGNEWCQRDIIDKPGGPTFVIDYDNRCAMFNGFYSNTDGSYDDSYEGNLGDLIKSGYVRIGNIYENLELLRG